MNYSLTKQSQDYSKWYNDIIIKSELAEFSGVRGFMIIKPYGFSIWENMKKELDKMLKESGHENIYFPLVIPKYSLFFDEKENNHFHNKECAVITHYRLKKQQYKNQFEIDDDAKLKEELIIRPTSESIVWPTYKRWIQSYRNLPILFNQWGNAVRWEMKTRLFIRTSEFLWQEGHTAHATKEEAMYEAKKILNIYTNFSEKFLAIPVIQGIKPNMDKFSGSDITYCIESIMQDGKALQIATSHFLGQNFSKAFNVKFMTKNGNTEYVWGTSWGISTRLIGALVMLHSDDHGLILPPTISPIQVIIIPIFKNQTEFNQINTIVYRLKNNLEKQGIRVKYDKNQYMTPGCKFHKYEMKGIPIRISIGPHEINNQIVELFRRDTYKKDYMSLDKIASLISTLLKKIQTNIYEKAVNRINNLSYTLDNYDEFKQKIRNTGGFIFAHWDGTIKTGKQIQEETEATIRCIPINNNDNLKIGGKCIYSGNPSDQRVIFAKSY
ncbi:proline--tRNA ligase [Blattabacterium cuenoti]|uniref:proline--tRNA ligase n=1 Tax=Blattabacterium cuenoti TaxID=1653831 RepID=UPI00163C076C|nr:proline--tRNA ligase [Blattabacterium cuenoti]